MPATLALGEVFGADAVPGLTGATFFAVPAGFEAVDDFAGVVPAFLMAPGFGVDKVVFFTGAVVEAPLPLPLLLPFFTGAAAGLVGGAGNAFFGVPSWIFF